MSTGRLCGICFCDKVQVCTCKIIFARARKREREQTNSVGDPEVSTNSVKVGGAQRPIVGTSQKLEKAYVRPSSKPAHHEVRPEKILEKSFVHCLQKNPLDLHSLTGQLKSIRQDLTVQNVRSCFAATVYEVNCRVSLILEDLSEVGQCLNAVQSLHSDGYVGRSVNVAALESPMNSPSVEFAAYRLMYSGMVSKTEDDGAIEVAELEKEGGDIFRIPCVNFAIQAVRSKGNPVLFGRLMTDAPDVFLKQMMQLFVPRLRLEWLRTLVMSCNDFVSARRLPLLLAFNNVEDARNVFAPIVKDGWNDGFDCRVHRRAILHYLDNLTQQRT